VVVVDYSHNRNLQHHYLGLQQLQLQQHQCLEHPQPHNLKQLVRLIPSSLRPPLNNNNNHNHRVQVLQQHRVTNHFAV